MRKHLTEEHKRKLSLANRGKKHKPGRWTLKSRRAFSRMMTGRKLHPWTEEQKQAQSIRIAAAWTPEMRLRQSRLKRGVKIGPWSLKQREAHSRLCTGKKASIETRMKKSGSNHPFWKGGVSTLQEMIRDLPEMVTWKKRILTRDRFRCTGCGSQRKVVAHHVIAFSELVREFLRTFRQFSPVEDREVLTKIAITHDPFWSESIGATLCTECHLEFHSIYGCDGTNNQKQFDEFIEIKNGVTRKRSATCS